MLFRVDADGGGLMVAVVGAEDRLARDDADLVAQIAAGISKSRWRNRTVGTGSGCTRLVYGYPVTVVWPRDHEG
jgi:hypothetical protein